MSDEVLKLRGVSVRRETSLLLRNVDWTAHEDERWIVIGPNGAGKTTLLQVAATILYPTEGAVEVLRFSDKALEAASHVSTALSSFVALHLGTAIAYPDVALVATYHGDLARVATLYRLDVVSPGWPDRWWESAS